MREKGSIATIHNIFFTVLTISLVLPKAILAYEGQSALPNTFDLTYGAGIALLFFWLGECKRRFPTRNSWYYEKKIILVVGDCWVVVMSTTLSCIYARTLLRPPLSRRTPHLENTTQRDNFPVQDDFPIRIQSIYDLPRSNTALYDPSRLCLEGTHMSVLNTIFEWLDASATTAPSIFWLEGLAGIGKTNIANTASKYCVDREKPVVFFSFAHGTHDSRLLFTTLAFQLAQYHTALRNEVIRAYKGEGILQSPPDVQFRNLILAPLDAVQNLFSPTLVVILDGLDQTDWLNPDSNLLDFLLSEMQKYAISLKILLTSRLSIATSTRTSSPSVQSLVLDRMPSAAHDIRLFLHHGLTELAEQIGREDWPTAIAIDKLVARSDGLFIIASTIMEHLRSHASRAPERLDGILNAHAALDHHPTRFLHGLFLQQIKGAMASLLASHEVTPSLVLSVIGVVVILYEPLPSTALSELLQEAETNIEQVLTHLRAAGVLTVSSREFISAHHSLRAYLTDPSCCTDSSLYVDAIRLHGTIAGACLSRIGWNSGITELREYCRRYWAFHLSESFGTSYYPPTAVRVKNRLQEAEKLMADSDSSGDDAEDLTIRGILLQFSSGEIHGPEPNPAKIDASVQLLSEAVKLTAKDDPQRPARLHSLGVSLRLRYQSSFGKTDGDGDIVQSVARLREAICVSGSYSPSEESYQKCLGLSLLFTAGSAPYDYGVLRWLRERLNSQHSNDGKLFRQLREDIARQREACNNHGHDQRLICTPCDVCRKSGNMYTMFRDWNVRSED